MYEIHVPGARATWDELHNRPFHGGRCRRHGGLSTGPWTAEGNTAIAERIDIGCVGLKVAPTTKTALPRWRRTWWDCRGCLHNEVEDQTGHANSDRQ
jgi:hypothetical protein